MSFLRNIFLGIFSWSVIRAFRTSVLASVLLTILASSGGWKYFTSTVTAHELLRSAAWTRTVDAESLPLVIEIDDVGYEKFFNAKSPLSRERIRALLSTIAAHTDAATRVTIDLDLSPVPGQSIEQAALQEFLFAQPNKWILPSVRGGNSEAVLSLRQWRAMMCARGIDFGLPYIPNEYGYPRMTHQYRNSLSDASVKHGTCADPDAPLVQKAMPLQPTYLKAGLVIPFSGDLDALASILDLVKPKAVVLGGAWGQMDVFATPFGERFGVQIHAAALAGAISGESLAPIWVELLLSWMFISIVTTCMFYTSRFISEQTSSAADNMVGHTFFATLIKPILLIVLAFTGFYFLIEALSMLHAATGFWLSATKACGTLVICLLVPWNMGRADPAKYRNPSNAVKDEVLLPIKNDLRSLGLSARIVSGKATKWVYNGDALPMSKGRAFFEGFCALMSLLLQSVFPVVSLAFIIYSSFGR